jgi:dihydroorotate dehydrogenase electron transfer subunit
MPEASAPGGLLRTLEIDRVEPAGGGCVRLVTRPVLMPRPKPAQFFMLRGEWGDDPLLPRPFSVARVRGAGLRGLALEFLLKVIGRGTARLAALEPGDRIQALGPLGNGFPPPPRGASVWMVAGGIGVAPFPALADALAPAGHRLRLLLGARTAAELPGTTDFDGLLGGPVLTATDDGTAGTHGTVVTLLRAQIEAADPGGGPDLVCTCGPERMMEAVAAVCRDLGVRCLASLEAPMACGIGTCRGCVILDAKGRNHTICTDGPVADAREIWG